MGVVHVKEITGRDHERDQRSHKRYVRVFQVITSHPTDAASLVLNHIAIPAYGDPWESRRAGDLLDSDNDARCIEKTATQNDGENLNNWTVAVRYAGVGDPTLEPPVVRWDTEKWQEHRRYDEDGRPIRNSAGEMFETGMVRDRSRRIFVFQRNQLFYDPQDANEYEDTVNSAPFLPGVPGLGFPAGTCKMDTISAAAAWYTDYPIRQTVHYWIVSYKISIDRRGWADPVLDHGYSEKITRGGVTQLCRIIQGNGGYTATPYLLDGNGMRLPIGADPVFLAPFRNYPSKDWGPLNITYQV